VIFRWVKHSQTAHAYTVFWCLDTFSTTQAEEIDRLKRYVHIQVGRKNVYNFSNAQVEERAKKKSSDSLTAVLVRGI
jgi:hypothetical protein